MAEEKKATAKKPSTPKAPKAESKGPAKAGYTPRLKAKYDSEVKKGLQEKYNYKS